MVFYGVAPNYQLPQYLERIELLKGLVRALWYLPNSGVGGVVNRCMKDLTRQGIQQITTSLGI